MNLFIKRYIKTTKTYIGGIKAQGARCLIISVYIIFICQLNGGCLFGFYYQIRSKKKSVICVSDLGQRLQGKTSKSNIKQKHFHHWFGSLPNWEKKNLCSS